MDGRLHCCQRLGLLQCWHSLLVLPEPKPNLQIKVEVKDKCSTEFRLPEPMPNSQKNDEKTNVSQHCCKPLVACCVFTD
jgi:hypothetical protein